MKRIYIVTALLALSLSACTQFRYGQTALGKVVVTSTNKKFNWGFVHCGDGRVCAEVAVKRVDIDHRDGGEVIVTLENRTSKQVAVQIALEILDSNNALLDQTTPQNVAIQPRQTKRWDMPGIYQENAKVKVILRAL